MEKKGSLIIQLEFILFAIISISVVSTVHINCNHEKQAACKTKYDLIGRVENCSNKQICDIPFGLDSNIQVLDLSNNKLTVIRSNAFAKYDSLTKLYLQNNSIREIQQDAFAQLKNLQFLDLSANQLQSIPTAALSGLSTLLVLNLQGNRISGIPNKAFRTLPSLTSLYLDGNYIQYIADHAFYGLSFLHSLELQNNGLRSLDKTVMQYFTEELKSIKLYNNPWFCDCKLRWLINYLKNASHDQLLKWQFHEGDLKCTAGPELVKDKVFSEMDESNFLCEISMYTSGHKISLQAGEKAELYCKYFSNPLVLPLWTKNGRKIGNNPQKYSLKNVGKKIVKSTLIIKNFQESDIGNYNCSLQNARGSKSISFSVTIDGIDPSAYTLAVSEEDANPRNTHAVKIALSVIGGFIFLLLLVGTIVYITVRYKRQKQRKLEERSMTFKEHLKTKVLNQSDITDTKYDLERTEEIIERPPSRVECDPLYERTNNVNTYISFKGELIPEPEEQLYSTTRTKGSDSSQCESTSPLLENCSPIVCDSSDLLYEPSHCGSIYVPRTFHSYTLNSRCVPSISSYDTYDTYLSYTPYSTLSHGVPYCSTPPPMNLSRKSASTSYIGPVPPKKPPRLFNSRDSMSVSHSSQSGSSHGDTPPKLSLPRPGTVDRYGTAV